MDGVELVATLQTLDLTGNGLRRIDALQDLAPIETLLLGGNPLEDISPLAGMSNLRRLSLANTPLTSGDLAVLQGLSGQLTVLDVSGVATLGADQISGLRAALPFTTIIAPDGRLLP
jgi:internalin A